MGNAQQRPSPALLPESMECANLCTAMTGRCILWSINAVMMYGRRYRSASIELTQLSANVEMLQLQLKAAHAQILAEWSLPYLAYPGAPALWQLIPHAADGTGVHGTRRLDRTVCAEASSAATIAENDGVCHWRAPQSMLECLDNVDHRAVWSTRKSPRVCVIRSHPVDCRSSKTATRHAQHATYCNLPHKTHATCNIPHEKYNRQVACHLSLRHVVCYTCTL